MMVQNGQKLIIQYLVLELIPNCDDYDEDKITLKYMNKYRIENVRRGSFVLIKLNKNEIDIINKMNKSVNNKCFNCGEIGHFAKNCHLKKSSNNYCNVKFNEYKKCFINSYLIDSSNISDDYTYYKKNNLSCYRCGRKRHYLTDCYTTKHNKGYYLK